MLLLSLDQDILPNMKSKPYNNNLFYGDPEDYWEAWETPPTWEPTKRTRPRPYDWEVDGE